MFFFVFFFSIYLFRISLAILRRNEMRLSHEKTDKGYRRVVAFPKPVAIVKHRDIKKLVEMDFIVIGCGGGGIPLIQEGRKFSSVEAKIDKDLASAKLAEEINADIFIIASDVEGAAIHCGKHIKIIGGKNVKEKGNYYWCSRKRFPQF